MQSSSLDLEQIYQILQKQFYISVDFPYPKAALVDAVEAFFKFLEEPDEVKNHINFSISTKHRRGDIGYQHRNPEDSIYSDSKHFFHFHPAIMEKYKSFYVNYPAVDFFLTRALPIWQQVYETISSIIQPFNTKYPGIYDKIFNCDNPHIILRFLRYNWHTSGKYLAKPHFDAGSFTLAIAESSPGLRIGSHPEDLQLVKHQEGKAVFMLGSNFKSIMQADDLLPSWHDAIQLDEAIIGRPYARWAVVAFIDGHDVEALPKSETHKYYKG